MSATVYTFNSYHLGDNLIFCHLLRALARQKVSRPFVHFCHACHIPQLQEVVNDLPNILLVDFESPLWGQHKHEAIDTWKNHQAFWENSKNRWDWSAHMLEHHAWTARRMGLESPFTCREHLLFDYPALHKYAYFGWPFDFLVIACEPCSGQFSPMAQHGSFYLDELIEQISMRHRVLVVGPTRVPESENLRYCKDKTISEIGYESIYCHHHVMVATGPMFSTFSTHNHHASEGRVRIALLDVPEQLNLPHITQCANVEQVREILKREGLL